MNSHVIFAGMLDDPYIDRVWLLLVLSLVGSLICFYRYKVGYAIIPLIGIVSAIFLRHFLEPETIVKSQLFRTRCRGSCL